ncbi:hypothetical protein D3C80_1493450 [compost metagenome]
MMRNITKICGTNTITPPTPAIMPLNMSSRVKSEAPIRSSPCVVTLVTGPDIKLSKRSESGFPSQSNVSLNVANIKTRKIGMPQKGCVAIASIFSVN